MSDWSDYGEGVGGTETAPYTGAINDLTGSTGLQIPDWLKQMLPASLGGTGAGNMGMMLPALAQAYQQWNNADDYTDRAEGYADRLDPFGSQRAGYQKQLSDLYHDPSKIEDTPGYKFALSQGLGSVNRGLMARKGGVSNSDDIAFASGLAQQTWNTEANRLSQLAGSQFGPQPAADMLKTGMEGSINARNQALQAMFYPFFSGQGGSTSGSGAPRPPGSPPPGSFGAPPGMNINPGIPPGSWSNIPDNTVPPGYTPGNSDVPPATDWTSGYDLPSQDQMDWGDYYDPGTYGEWQP